MDPQVIHKDPEFTVEWARQTLKDLDFKPRKPLNDYLSGPDLITAKLALKVLAVNDNPAMRQRCPRYAVHEAGGRVRIKVFLSPKAPTINGLRRI